MNIKALSPGSPWRTVLLLIVVAAADFLLSLVQLGMGLENGSVPADPGAAEFIRYAIAPVLAPLGAVALIWRHRFPKSVAAAVADLGALSFSGIAFFVALFLLARRRVNWWVAGVIAVGIGAEALVGIEPLGWDGALLGVVGLSTIAAWGAYRGQRARLMVSRMVSLKERAERAEAERAAETGRSRLAERHRIARGSESVPFAVEKANTKTSNYNGGHVDEGERQPAAPHATGAGPETLGQSRQAPSRQAPSGIGQIAGLVAGWCLAGLTIEYAPNPALVGGIPDAVSRAAYRVVQEGITNVARHAPGAEAAVTLELHGAEPDSALSDRTEPNNPASAGAASGGPKLHILVANGPGGAGERAVGSGLGLVGLAERIRLLGGTLEHGRTDSGFSLLATLPFDHQESVGVAP